MGKKKTIKSKESSKASGHSIQLQIIFCFILFGSIVAILSLTFFQAQGWLIPSQPEIQMPAYFGEGAERINTIRLSDLTLEQKIAQMIIVHGGLWNLEPWKRMQVGGVHIFALEKEELFKETINEFQTGMSIPFLISVDLEGCKNPFANFKDFPAASMISNEQEALEKGVNEGTYLAWLGISLNFAPVVDLEDQIWKCRSFPGNESTISNLASAYIFGLQSEGVLATAKHYPGRTLVIGDPHRQLVTAAISAADIYPYLALSNQTKGVMVSHIIVSGAVDSEGKPAVVSKKIMDSLKEQYSGLIISDEVNMLGLKNFYSNTDQMYLDLFKAGNDIILNFNEDPQDTHRMIQLIKKAVENGEISLKQIDNSVKKILEAKGFVVE
ncbi:hypothetical protein J4437_01485 [Candidatus Woesearchaeota archaeon]|nr:hypothetical protein [Candidatus Woesearchaeota archaeon]